MLIVLAAVRCIQLGRMGQTELFEMDSHPLLHKSERTLKLVGHSFPAVCSGSSHPTKLAGVV